MECGLMIDVQNDFMKKDGKLYVPGAEEIIPGICETIKELREYNSPIIASADCHFGNKEMANIETELECNGGLFPMHCQENTIGANIIKEVEDLCRFKSFPNTGVKLLKTVSDMLIDMNVGVVPVIQKQTYNIFSNEVAKHICGIFDTFYVLGVATEYCVKEAVLGLLKMGKRVIVVEYAIQGVNDIESKKAIDLMMKGGAVLKICGKMIP